tara:strand:- start:142 stop:402 length:261 start_codon:yes stop_codon:yes gene_type:complete
MDYMHLHTHDYKIAFCQATNELCEDVQRIIWEKSQKYEYENLVCPGAPEKQLRNTRFSKERLETLARKWKEKWGEPTLPTCENTGI